MRIFLFFCLILSVCHGKKPKEHCEKDECQPKSELCKNLQNIFRRFWLIKKNSDLFLNTFWPIWPFFEHVDHFLTIFDFLLFDQFSNFFPEIPWHKFDWKTYIKKDLKPSDFDDPISRFGIHLPNSIRIGVNRTIPDNRFLDFSHLLCSPIRSQKD